MGNLFAELKRRHIYRVAAAYAVVAWVLLQIVNNLAPGLNLPNWAVSFVIVILAVGFPIALIFAWILHLHSAAPAPHAKSSGVDWILAGAAAAVIAIFLYQQAGRPASQQASANSSPQPGEAIAIAVLPFANVSADAGQEYFSDGMTDEITSALANVRKLKVIGRSSAYQFKGQNRDLRAIGQELGASHLIEGSVRRAGERVRITAELVRAADGVSLWSDNYDRQLTDIFAIQEDIAHAIAKALAVPLGLAQGDTLVRDRTIDPESYQQYLQALTLRRSLELDRAIAILEPLVAQNPGYAPAWSLLSYAYRTAPALTPVLRSGSVDEARHTLEAGMQKAEAAAQKAIALDAKLATGYAALAALRYNARKWVEADDLFRKARELDPNDSEILESYRFMLVNTGFLSAAVRVGEQIQMLEPFVPIYNIHRAEILELVGSSDESIRILEAAPTGIDSYSRNTDLARAYAVAGRFADAADTLLAMKTAQVSRDTVEAAAKIIRGAPKSAAAPEKLPVIDGSLNFVYAFVGAKERALERHERNLEIGAVGSLYWLWDPQYAALRKTERFKTILTKAGLPDYWRVKGFPDFCRSLGPGDFICD